MKKIIKSLIFAMVLTLAMATTAHAAVTVKKITPQKKTMSVLKGKSCTINTTIAPKSAANKTLKYKSSNPNVAKVNKKGVVTGMKKGTAIITITAKDKGGAVATVKIKVKKPVKQIKTYTNNLRIFQGNKWRVRVKALPRTADNRNLSFKIADTNIATVNAKGVIKAKNPGITTLTIKTKDGSGLKKKIKVSIRQKIVLGIDTAKLNSSSYTTNTKIVWNDPEKVLSQANLIVKAAGINESNTMTLNGVPYTFSMTTSKGIQLINQINNQDCMLKLLKGHLVNGPLTIKSNVTIAQVNRVLDKIESAMNKYRGSVDFGSAVITVNGKTFNFAGITFYDGNSFKCNLDQGNGGTNVIAGRLKNRQISTSNTEYYDDAVDALIAMTGGVFKVISNTRP